MIDLANFDTIPVQRETFTVDNDAKADWAMRKLASIRSKKAENEELAAEERERVALWLEHANGAFDDDVEYFEGQLRRYAEVQRAEGRKSIELPHGKIKSRATSAKFDVIDKDAFLAWAHLNAPELIKVTESPAISAMNSALVKADDADAAITADGEVVPGVAVTPGGVNYTIDTVK